MNVRFGLACLGLLICCWCYSAPSASAASNGIRPRRQSRRATLNEYLTPPAPPNAQAFRGPGIPRHPRNQPHHGGPLPPQLSQASESHSPPFRNGKILAPLPTEPPGYFARLMRWFNPFGGPATQRPPPAQQQQQHSDNIHQQTFNSGHQQTSPSANGLGPSAASYGKPAPSYGPPTNPHHGHSPAEKLPFPPSPQGGQAYLPPARSRNCNPCNQVPWIPLYQGVNTEDARYAASATNVALPEPTEPLLNPQKDNGGTNVHHASSFSQEVQVPDFGYGLPSSPPVRDTNLQPSASSVQLNINNNNNNNYNQNFHARIETRFPFTGPIPNPHLYPGAMPPLFKAKPFHAQPLGIDSSLDLPKSSVDYSQPETSFPGGGIGDKPLGGVNPAESSFSPSIELNAPLPGSQDYQSNKQLPHNGASSPSLDHPLEQQQSHNIGTSFNAAKDHEQSSSHHSEATLKNEGYVEELPPGAETVPSGSDDHFSPNTFHEDQTAHNGAANSDYRDTLNSSSDYGPQSGTASDPFSNVNSQPVGKNDFQSVGTDFGNGPHSTNHGSQVFSDGQHVIHYEQSPIIDLSALGDDKSRQNSNDSSASSSTSTGTVEDPPVVLQNQDGTYGINATWAAEDPPRAVWPDDDSSEKKITPVTASLSLEEFPSVSNPSSTFGNSESSNANVASNAQKNQPHSDGYSEQSLRNNSSYQGQGIEDSRHENLTGQQSYDTKQNENVDAPRHSFEGLSMIPESLKKQGQALLNLYPGLTRFEDTQSYGFKLPDPPKGATSDEPFLRALMKSYNDFKKNAGQNRNQVSTQPGSRQTWFDLSQIHSGLGFKPSRDQLQRGQTSEEGILKSSIRQQGAKKNKQVQIIIPYTSQYTPKPFHPLPDDWSTKTLPAHTQARKVPMYDSNRDYLAQETREVENEVSQTLEPFKNSSRTKEPNGAKANTSIDVLRLQKNIDNWTIQEYSRGTTASTEAPKFSRPYLSPSKKIPNEYLTTTEPVVSSKNTLEETETEIEDVLAGFSFNDLEHEGSASDQVDISHVQVSSHINEVSSVFPQIVETTTSTNIMTSTIGRDTWKELPVSISPLNKERVYVVTPQSVSTVPTTRRSASYDKPSKNETTKVSKTEPDLDQFESIERAYQVLPQAVNNLVVASTGPATMPLWGIMEHEKYASDLNNTTPEVPILYAGHSKVSHAGQ